MSEAPKRIWAWWDDDYDVGVVSKHGDKSYIPHEAREYIRREDVLAAIKRALEGAAQSVDCACAGREAVLQCSHRNSRTRWESCGEANCLALEAADIRALDPAQFIEEEK
jgi:hypothetical protein